MKIYEIISSNSSISYMYGDRSLIRADLENQALKLKNELTRASAELKRAEVQSTLADTAETLAKAGESQAKTAKIVGGSKTENDEGSIRS